MKNERTPRQLRDSLLQGVSNKKNDVIEIAFNVAAILVGTSIGLFFGVLIGAAL